MAKDQKSKIAGNAADGRERLNKVWTVTMCALRTELGATFGLLLRCSSGRLMRLRSGLLIWDGSRRRDCAGVDETGSSNPGRLIINFV